MRRAWIAGAAAVAVLPVGLTGVGPVRAVPAPVSRAAILGQPPRPAWPLHEPPSAPREALVQAPPSSTPDRVEQFAGQAGYAFDLPTTGPASLTTTITVPTVNCGQVPFSLRNNTYGIQITLEMGADQAMLQTFCAPSGIGAYQQFNEINFSSPNFQSSGYFASVPGRQVAMSESRTGGVLTATITDLTVPSNTKTVTFTTGSDGGGYLGVLDAGVEDPSNGGVPPYTPVAFSSTDVDGGALGLYLQSGVNFAEQNSVWVANLQDQTSDIGSADNFTITNANLSLPTVSVSSPPGVERPSSGTATVSFIVALSFASTSPVYLDYATKDDGATAGSDYTATSGTLTFAPGTTSHPVAVTVLAGPETGGELDFLLDISSPSYAYNPPGSAGVGRIYAGPIVLQANPDVVPLTGGDPMTLTGVFFGPAGSADTVHFCAAGGGACTTAASRTVASDTSITLTVPDLTGIAPTGARSFVADTEVTDAHGFSSPLIASDEVRVGCSKVVNQAVGAWSYTGCVTQTDSTDSVTEQRSFLDGMPVSASPTDQVDYSTGGSAGDAVSSTATSTVALNVAGELDSVFRGRLSQGLGGVVTFTPPAGTLVEGMTLSGAVTLTPGVGNQATGSVSVKVPPWLGSGGGTMTFTTSSSGGVSNLAVQVPQASFGNLLNLTGVSLSWSSTSGWQLNGTATAGGGAAETALFNGSATYVKNKLTAASLSIPGDISVFGIFHISAVDFTFSSTQGWSGTATLTQGNGGGTATITLAADADGTVTGGSLVLSPSNSDAYLGEIVPVQLFTLTYVNGGWTATGVLPVGDSGSISGNLMVVGGIINSAGLSLKSVPVGGWLKVKSASLTYTLLNGQHVWTGAFDVRLAAQTGVLTGIQANLTLTNGAPTAGGLGLVGNVPVPFLTGVFFNQLGATLQWVPLPVTVKETHIAIGLGPIVGGGQIASLLGTFTRDTPQVPLVGSYTYTGALAIFGAPVGSASATLTDSGGTTLTLTLGPGGGVPLKLGPVSLLGQLTGSWGTSKFTLDGSGTIALKGEGTFSGTIHVEKIGMAACQGTTRGFKWIFGDVPVLQPQGKCSTAGF